MNEKPKRRWFAFRLRTLLVVAGVLSVPMGWVAYQFNRSREEQKSVSDEEPLILVYVPALVVLLVSEENNKGAPLTEEEVLRIRDNGTVVAIPASKVGAIVEGRGYDDIDPANVWVQWQQARLYLKTPKTGGAGNSAEKGSR